MFKALRFRFILIFFFLFMALFWDFYRGELRSTVQTGVCEEYDFVKGECKLGSNLKTVAFLPQIVDLVTLVLVVGLTFLGSWFRQDSLVNKLEKASHLAKDCGQLFAAIGAVITFSYVFYEPFLHVAFKIIFLSYMYGQILGYILTVITNYLRSSEETVIAPAH